jgi:uncharacterized membrane protein SirB2
MKGLIVYDLPQDNASKQAHSDISLPAVNKQYKGVIYIVLGMCVQYRRLVCLYEHSHNKKTSFFVVALIHAMIKNTVDAVIT